MSSSDEPGPEFRAARGRVTRRPDEERQESMGARHSHERPTRLRMTTLAWVVLAPLALLTVVGLILMWPSVSESPERRSSAQELDGVVIAVEPEDCPAGT